ncbi:hypothetical protein V6N11_028848 [Hibiscus sabdariffa]|uniref:Uncharacterized protein n=1 Tax=Hibiscus sabdariffa TaxID=183260 RepID=A0ABR2PR31_9ROSI
MLFRFRDSLNLLPGKLSELAKNLCPDLGMKGSIPYDELKASERSVASSDRRKGVRFRLYPIVVELEVGNKLKLLSLLA